MAPQRPAAPQPLSIVTGVSVGGIGLEVAAGLRQAGHHVVLACRNTQRCEAAKAELDGRGLAGSCQCRSLDLADFASVRAFAAGMEAAGSGRGRRPQLNVLVNNAGVMGVPPGPDGECTHLRANHSGPYLLTRLLLPLMAPGGRVVTVASEAHRRGSLRFRSGGSSSSGSSGSGSGATSSSQASSSSAGGGRAAGALAGGAATASASQPVQLDGPTPSFWLASYGRSKLANILMTAELSRRLAERGSSVTAYSVSPGRVATNIFATVPGLLAAPIQWLAGWAFQTPAQGARTVLKAALDPQLAGRSELYMHAQRPCQPSAAARDPGLAAALWQWSNQEVGLSPTQDAALWPPH